MQVGECVIAEDEVMVLGKQRKHAILKRVMVKGKMVYECNGSDMEMMLTSINKDDFPEHISRFLSIPLRRLNIITSVFVPDHFRIPYYMKCDSLFLGR